MDVRNVDKRDSILRLQMDEREKEFTTLQNFKIFVGQCNNRTFDKVFRITKPSLITATIL